jgi:hypothetical protein
VIELLIVVPVTVPIDQKIVARSPRQDVDVNVEHRLAGEFAIRLHQAYPAWSEHLVYGARHLRDSRCDRAKRSWRHVEHRFEMRLWDDQAMPVIGRMNVHECESRIVAINFVTLAGSCNDPAEDAVAYTHVGFPFGPEGGTRTIGRALYTLSVSARALKRRRET